jgi:hypothetical protein
MPLPESQGQLADSRQPPWVRLLLWLTDGLTGGQRWTASLAVGLALVVLMFGLPAGTRTLFDPRSGEPMPSAASAGAHHVGSSPSDDLGPGGATEPGPAAGGNGPPPEPASEVPPTVPEDSFAPAPPLRVALLVEPSPVLADEEAQLPGGVGVALLRTDRVIAQRFFDIGGFTTDVIEIGEPERTCSEAVEADLVLASGTLDPLLRACLAASETTTVAFDSLGPLDAEGTGGGVRSLRRGIAQNLVAMPTSLPSGALDGRVGIVADPALRRVVEATVPELERQGVDVTRRSYLAATDPVTPAVLDHLLAGVDVVVFAGEVNVQNLWAAQHAALQPSVRFVVADAADAVLNDTHGPAMDGAVALTPLALPWATAAGDAERADWMADCIELWEAAQIPPVTLASEEWRRVLVWCQQLELATEIRAEWDGERTMREVLAAIRPAPRLTSPLRDRGEGFGPAGDAALRWTIGCRCWEPIEGFDLPGARDRDD